MNEVSQVTHATEWTTPGAIGMRGDLFVINLCASMTPMSALPKQLKGFEKYRLYQVSRQEDGRRRYRLRLGFFTSEADAEMAVSAIRNIYPTAFSGCITSEDQRFLTDVPPEVNAPAARNAPAPQAGAPPAAVTVTPIIAAPARAARPATQTPVQPQMPAAPADMTARYPALQMPAATRTPAAPTRISTATAASTPTTPAAPAVKPATSAPRNRAQIVPAAVKPIVAASIVESPRKQVDVPLPLRAPQIVDDYVPVLDSTLTIRTLTSTEASDPNRAKWFVVQLALSEQPVNLDAMPKLDIFAAYSLYSVALMEGGTIRHALRLGFFREHVSADAVMGYLKTFFNAPTVNQVSVSEYERFAESKPRTAAPAQDKVVNLESKRETPAQAVNRPKPPSPTPSRSVQPTGSQRSPVTNGNATRKPIPATRQPSFLSRLIGRQLD